MPAFEALLHQVLEAGDPENCRAFTLAFAREEERETLAPIVRLLAKRGRVLYAYAMKSISDEKPRGRQFAEFTPDELIAARRDIPGHYRRACILAQATFAVGTFAEVKAFPRDLWSRQMDEVKAILLQRRPEWLPEFVILLLDHRWTSGPSDFDAVAGWMLVDDLVATGVIPEPDDDRYALHMVATRRTCFHLKPVGALEYLRARPHLLRRQVWRIFDLPAAGTTSVTAYDSFAGIIHQRRVIEEDGTWRHAFVTLSGEGRLDRARLLGVTLEALARDFPGALPAWYARLHEALEPTADERASRFAGYRLLLGAQNSAAMRLALNALRELEVAGRLLPGSLLDDLRAPLSAREASLVELAIGFLDRAAKADPAVRPRVLLLATEALANSSTAVQKRVIRLLAAHRSALTPETIEAAAGWLPGIAASLRAELRRMLGMAETTPVQMKATEMKGDVAPVLLRLAPERRLAPLRTVHEVVEAAAHVLETPFALEDWERVVEAIIRLGTAAAQEERRAVAPLLKRAVKLRESLVSRYHGSPRQWREELLPFLDLIVTWGEGARPNHRGTHYHPALLFLFERMQEVTEAMLRGDRLPLLSAPTHTGFWVEPIELARRAQAWAAAGRTPPLHDFVLALLRLPPEAHAPALPLLREIGGEWGAVLRYALGGDERPAVVTTAGWIAAARARHPRADDPVLRDLAPELGPGAGAIASWRIEIVTTHVTNPHNGRTFVNEMAHPIITPAAPPKPPRTHLSVWLHSKDSCNNGETAEDADPILGYLGEAHAGQLHWIRAYWPSDTEALCGIAALFLVRRENRPCVESQGVLAAYQILGDHFEPFGPNARLLLALGLMSPLAETRLASVTIFAQAIGEGRLVAAELAAALHLVAGLKLLSIPRLRKSILEAARVSPDTRKGAFDCLAAFLAAATASEPRPGLSSLKSALRELELEG